MLLAALKLGHCNFIHGISWGWRACLSAGRAPKRNSLRRLTPRDIPKAEALAGKNSWICPPSYALAKQTSVFLQGLQWWWLPGSFTLDRHYKPNRNRNVVVSLQVLRDGMSTQLICLPVVQMEGVKQARADCMGLFSGLGCRVPCKVQQVPVAQLETLTCVCACVCVCVRVCACVCVCVRVYVFHFFSGANLNPSLFSPTTEQRVQGLRGQRHGHVSKLLDTISRGNKARVYFSIFQDSKGSQFLFCAAT